MILILRPSISSETAEFEQLMTHLRRLKNIELRVHSEQGVERSLTEIHLIGKTAGVSSEEMKALSGVEQVVRVSEEYRVLGRHKEDNRPTSFEYQGVHFSRDSLHVFASLCAVDTPECVEAMMRALRDNGQVCTRMGAYKPRTSPYSFQGHGKKCLPYVFELAGKYGIRMIAMEVTHESHLFAAQGVIAGANMVLGDFHPAPERALVDAEQALKLDELPMLLTDIEIARTAFEKRVHAIKQQSNKLCELQRAS